MPVFPRNKQSLFLAAARNNLLRFGCKFLLFFILLSLAWTFLGPGYNKMVAGTANLLSSIFERPLTIIVKVAGGEKLLVYQRRAPSDKEPEFLYSYRGYIFFDLALLVALFLAAPNLGVLRRIKKLAIALGILFAFHAISLIMDSRLLPHIYPLGLEAGYTNEAYPYVGLSIFLELGRTVFAVLLWGLFTFRHWLPQPKIGTRARAANGTGRNDPCPCGSGKKYKLCCGK